MPRRCTKEAERVRKQPRPSVTLGSHASAVAFPRLWTSPHRSFSCPLYRRHCRLSPSLYFIQPENAWTSLTASPRFLLRTYEAKLLSIIARFLLVVVSVWLGLEALSKSCTTSLVRIGPAKIYLFRSRFVYVTTKTNVPRLFLTYFTFLCSFEINRMFYSKIRCLISLIST